MPILSWAHGLYWSGSSVVTNPVSVEHFPVHLYVRMSGSVLLNVPIHLPAGSLHANMAELSRSDVQFPLPLSVETDLGLETEDNQGLFVDGGTATAVLNVGGVVPTQGLHVIGEN